MPTYTHVIEFDEAELVCRIVEAFSHDVRPKGMSASDCVGSLPPEMQDRFLRVAHVVRDYMHETIANAKRVQ